MKRFFLILLSLSLFLSYATAQINLREGIVITLQGDTLHGDIDYRTDAINAEKCVFIANGETQYKTYLPGEIQGYRFVDNGRYYVSKEVPTHADSKFKKMVFVEYVVKGNVSFYYLSTHSADLFMLEDEKGELVSFGNIDQDTPLSLRRRKLTNALLMLGKSKKAQEKLWKSDMDKDQIKKITRFYNDEVCPDGQCEIYEYPAPKTPKAERGINWVVKAGYSPQQFSYSNDDPEYPLSIPTAMCPGYRVSVGIDIHQARISKGLYLQVYGSFAQAKNENIQQESNQYGNPYKYYYTEGSLTAGAAYELPLFRTPAKCMFFAGYDFSVNAYRLKFPVNGVTDNEVWLNFRTHYYGARLSYPIGKHSLLVEAQFFHKSHSGILSDDSPTKRPALMFGWRF